MEFTFEKARDQFDEWYQKCLEYGIEPEQVIDSIGEMKLLVNLDQIETYEKACEIESHLN